MPKYIKELTLDISGKRNNQTITAKQGDNKSRFIRITLVDGETKVTLEQGENVDFRCLKPDKKSCKLPTTIEEGGTILVELDDNALAVAGLVRADVEINNADGLALSSTTFYIQVEPSADNGNYIPSTSNQKMARSLDMDGHGIQNLPEPKNDGDAVNKQYVDNLKKQVEENKKQDEKKAQEIQKIKNNVNGVRVTYVDLPKPTPQEYNYGTSKHVSIFFYITYFSLDYDEETKQTQTTDVRTNLPPLTYDLFDGGGVGNEKYKCEFLNEGFMIDASVVEPTITEYTPTFVSLEYINSIVEDLGGKFVFNRFLNSPMADTQLTMQYDFRFEFADETTRDAFTNEFIALLLAGWCGMFVETYIPEAVPEETISEVI